MPKAELLARILETPHLAKAVPRLPPVAFHRIIESCGLEDCAELVALATPQQLSAVFDLDLWRSVRPGMDEAFDAARFGVWLDVLAESGTAFAAHKLAAIDAGLVTAALGQFVSVFDPAVTDGDAVVAARLKDRLQCEVGGYLVAAKRTDSWDTIVGVLVALAEEHPDRFHRVMGGCRRLSNSKPEADGFHDLLDDQEQAWFDLAFDRERRQEKLGYLTPAQARAFLQSSRQVGLEPGHMSSPNPLLTAYLRALDGSDIDEEDGEASQLSETPPSEQAAAAVAAVVDVLLDAGVLPERPRALLGAAEGQVLRLARFHEHMEFVREDVPAAHSVRSQELAFLANVLIGGCSLQNRPFTMREAFEGALAICNLGLENWRMEAATTLPEDFLASCDLASVFQVGWTVLHRNVCMFAAEQLLSVLSGLECSDRELQFGLHRLRREMTRHLEAGEPWRARGALDVIALLDMPAWAALLGLIAECPVMLANVAGSRQSQPRSIGTTAFEFVSENKHIMAVREFMQSVPDALRG
jgi:hypothetical protein